jgi:hypothetical protein
VLVAADNKGVEGLVSAAATSIGLLCFSLSESMMEKGNMKNRERERERERESKRGAGL